MRFGDNLISLRESCGMSRKELAEKLDIPYTTLRNYETNKREPGHMLLIKVSKLFSVSVDYLIGAIQNQKPTPVSESGLDETDLKVAHAYHDADDGTQAAVRKLLDVDEDLAIVETFAAIKRELQEEAKGAAQLSASPDAKQA